MKKEKMTIAQKRRMGVERYNRELAEEKRLAEEKEPALEEGVKRQRAGATKKASVKKSKDGTDKKEKREGKKLTKKAKSIICIVVAALILLGTVGAVLINSFMKKEMFGGYDEGKYGEVVLDAKLDGVFTCLLVVADKGGSNTDTIILVVMRDKGTKQIDLISIPRDTRVKNPYGNGYVKINSIFARSGWKLNALVEQVRALTGIPINDFMFVNIAGVKRTVDMFGGVDFDVPMDMDYEDPYQGLYIHLKKGMQRLDGNKAEQLLRYRYGYANADLGRTQVQRDFMIAAFKQHAKVENLDKISKWYEEMKGYIQTKMQFEDAYEIASVAVKYADEFKIESRILPGTVITGYPDYFYDAEKINEMAKELGFTGRKVQSTPIPNGGSSGASINSTDDLMTEDNQVGFGEDDDFEGADEIMPTEAPPEEGNGASTTAPDENENDEGDEPSDKPDKTEKPSATKKPSDDDDEALGKPNATKKPTATDDDKPSATKTPATAKPTATPSAKPTQTPRPTPTPKLGETTDRGYPDGI